MLAFGWLLVWIIQAHAPCWPLCFSKECLALPSLHIRPSQSRLFSFVAPWQRDKLPNAIRAEVSLSILKNLLRTQLISSKITSSHNSSNTLTHLNGTCSFDVLLYLISLHYSCTYYPLQGLLLHGGVALTCKSFWIKKRISAKGVNVNAIFFGLHLTSDKCPAFIHSSFTNQLLKTFLTGDCILRQTRRG